MNHKKQSVVKNSIKSLTLVLCAAGTLTFDAQIAKTTGLHNLIAAAKVHAAENDIFGTRNFVENKGQFINPLKNDEKVLFVYDHGNEKIFFTSSGLIYDQVKRPALREEREEREEEESEKEYEHFYVKMNWLAANKNSSVSANEKQRHYVTHGKKELNAYCYKIITYKNVYDNIDIEYTIPVDKTSGVKYNVILHPGADPAKVKIAYTGDVKKISKNSNGEIVITTPLDPIIEHTPKTFYSDNTPIALTFELNRGVIGFVFPSGYESGRTVIIDPWVTTIASLSTNNSAFDVDYDDNGNTYIYGGSGPFKIAMYNSAGVLQWTFGGTVGSPAWTNSSYASNFAVEKSTGKSYTGQGFVGGGAQVIRIDNLGNYDNFISTADMLYKEIWELGFHCTGGDVFILGGTTAANAGNLSGATINLVTSTLVPATFQPNVSGCCMDIVSHAADDQGKIFVIFASLSNTAVNNKLCLVNPTFNGNIWTQPSGFNSLNENGNKGAYQPGTTSNGFNCLAVNSNFLFYYDGLNLAAYSKLTGASIATLAITGQVVKRQGGIAADECNNVYLGGNSSILAFNFNGTTFNPLANIPLGVSTPTQNVQDIKLDGNNNLLYVCGTGFVGTYQASYSGACGAAGNFSVTASTLSVCPGESVTLSASGANSYTWSMGGNNSAVIVNPTVTTSYSVVGSGTITCGSFTSTVVKTISVVPMSPPSVSGPKLICKGSSATLFGNGGATYTWNVGTPSLIVSQSVVVSPVVNTVYTVTATNALNTCSSKTTVAISVSACVGVTEIVPEAELANIYPNPVKDKLFIEMVDLSLKNFDVAIYNALGQVLYSAEKLNLQQGAIHTVEVGALPKGIYLVSIQSGQQKQTFRLVRE